MEKVVLKKRMCAVWGKLQGGRKAQMIGSGCINRKKGGREAHCSPDCMWVDPMLPDLRYKEGEVEVDMTITLEPHDGSVPMWVFGIRRKSRKMCTGRKPEFVSIENEGTLDMSETWKFSGSCIYVNSWCDRDSWPEIDEDVFQVYVSVKRSENKKV